MTTIQRLFARIDKRLIALFAVLAIGTSGMASMANLTGSLTTTTTFEAAKIVIEGNGTPTATTLFAVDQAFKPGDTFFAGLDISNGGNVAATVSYIVPPVVTQSDNLADAMLVTVYKPSALWVSQHPNGEAPSCNVALIGWDVQNSEAKWNLVSLGTIPLNAKGTAGDTAHYCYQSRLPSTAVATGTMKVVQTLTATAN
jgi:hypothetical protein